MLAVDGGDFTHDGSFSEERRDEHLRKYSQSFRKLIRQDIKEELRYVGEGLRVTETAVLINEGTKVIFLWELCGAQEQSVLDEMS